MSRFLQIALFVFSAKPLSAGIIFTREASGIQQTTVTSAITETFDALPAGAFGPYVSALGTYSGGGAIVSPNVFGGAYQTPYISVGVQSGNSQYSLSFASLKTYLGFYWSAGDIFNFVDFYDGATLQATFGVGDIIAGLPAAYFGNPNTGGNPAQPYVYLNFTSSDLASRFDRVVFRSTSLAAGFETDNHSVYDRLIPPPGVPEPSTVLLIGSAFTALAILRTRRRYQA